MKKKITLILFALINLFFVVNCVEAESNKNLVNIYFFHSDSCAHCKEEQNILDELEKRYANIKIYSYEIHIKQNNDILEYTRDLYDIKTKGVPITIIGNKVYEGFSHEFSNLKFIKTIEYYSRYGYEDKLGSYLNLELPSYKLDNNGISLDEFMDDFHNYKLLGLSTDQLGYNNSAIVLGLLSLFNSCFIISTIFILFIINKFNMDNKSLLFLVYYIGIDSLLLIINLIGNNILLFVVYILLLIMFIFNFIRSLKGKKQFIILNIIIVTCLFINFIDINFNESITVFKNILSLYDLKGFSRIIYFSNYLIMNLSLNILLISLINVIFKGVLEKKHEYNRKNKTNNKNDNNKIKVKYLFE